MNSIVKYLSLVLHTPFKFKARYCYSNLAVFNQRIRIKGYCINIPFHWSIVGECQYNIMYYIDIVVSKSIVRVMRKDGA